MFQYEAKYSGRLVTATPVKVLLIDRSLPLIAHISAILREVGYGLISADSYRSAVLAITNAHADVVLVDPTIQDGNGDQLIRLASDTGAACIVATADGSDETRLRSLSLGAIDHIKKPILSYELQLKIKNIIDYRTRCRIRDTTPKMLGDCHIDTVKRTIRSSSTGLSAHLSDTELRLLNALLEAPQVPMSRQLISQLVNGKAQSEHSRALDMLVSNLRKKLREIQSPLLIESLRGQGYILSMPADQGL